MTQFKKYGLVFFLLISKLLLLTQFSKNKGEVCFFSKVMTNLLSALVKRVSVPLIMHSHVLAVTPPSPPLPSPLLSLVPSPSPLPSPSKKKPKKWEDFSLAGPWDPRGTGTYSKLVQSPLLIDLCNFEKNYDNFILFNKMKRKSCLRLGS